MPIDVKICGLKTAEALDAAIAGGADFVGLVFCEASPRNISIADASRLAERVRGKAKITALLVDPSDDTVHRIVDEVAPDLLQLHGRETPERVAEIRRLAERPIMKAIGVSMSADVEKAARFAKQGAIADIVLFDAKPPKDASRTGGHGVAFDWKLLAGISPSLRWMLSGGLAPNNVANAIRVTGAKAVDVSSGVESAPGVKDTELIRRFIIAAKTAKP